ncbi:MAG: patatin-like phospholipase family protein [Nanoarchaeota archaeon]|nr:patatin-like phospholipase family protein [Nanoarchaeota archaeon]
MKKLAIVLSSGGARSFFHLGFLKVLQDEGVNIDLIVGCSGGALIGSLFANNVSIEDIKKEFYKISSRVSWFKPRIGKGFFSQEPIINIFKMLKSDVSFKDLKIPLIIVASNISKGFAESFSKGRIIPAVCASTAIPGLYSPVKIKNSYYFDGGLFNYTPSDIARKNIGRNNVVVSVDLSYKSAKNNIEHMNVVDVLRICALTVYKKCTFKIKDYSNLLITPFNGSDYNFKDIKTTVGFYSKKSLEKYYKMGEKAARKNLNKIMKLLKE